MTKVPDYQALFQASPYPYMLLDLQLTVIAANPAYLAVTGGRAGDLIGGAAAPGADTLPIPSAAPLRLL